MTRSRSSELELVLEAGSSDHAYWREVWRYRELLWVLAWRDIAARYKQTVLGVAWAVLQPLLTMLILTVVFGRLAGLPTYGRAPYAIMVYAGMLPWYIFSTALQRATLSLITNQSLVTKVYFPRLIIPGAAVIATFADLLAALLVMLVLMIIFGFAPDWRLVTLPLFVALACVVAPGAGLWLTALNVKYRDFRYMIPFILQFGLYVSPIGYSTSVVRERLGETAGLVYSLNPMVAAIDGFRWSVLAGEVELDLRGFVVSLVVAALCLAAGSAIFVAQRKASQS